MFDARILRVLRAAGCPPQIVGKPQRIGDVMAYAGLFEPDPVRLADYRVTLGMGDSVLAPGAKELIFA